MEINLQFIHLQFTICQEPKYNQPINQLTNQPINQLTNQPITDAGTNAFIRLVLTPKNDDTLPDDILTTLAPKTGKK